MDTLDKTIVGVLGAFTLYVAVAIGYNPKEIKYDLPQSIPVEYAWFTNKEGEEIEIKSFSADEPTLEQMVINPEDIDFSEYFEVKTDRYRLVKSDDWLPSRLLGHFGSLFAKLIFLDSNIGWGLDENRSRAVLSMLEKDEEIKDLTVRINHTEAFYDTYRMFTEEKLTERNNILARATIGLFDFVKDELWAEFFRGDYYNPMTKTVVVYSNVESISAHEIGHHKDFSFFTSDWEYSLTGMLPPGLLYIEAQASLNARDLLHEDQQSQFYRYLIPAFLTYLFGGLLATGSILKHLNKEKEPDITETSSIYVGSVGVFLTGLVSYKVAAFVGLPYSVSCAAFVGGVGLGVYGVTKLLND